MPTLVSQEVTRKSIRRTWQVFQRPARKNAVAMGLLKLFARVTGIATGPRDALLVARTHLHFQAMVMSNCPYGTDLVPLVAFMEFRSFVRLRPIRIELNDALLCL